MANPVLKLPKIILAGNGVDIVFDEEKDGILKQTYGVPEGKYGYGELFSCPNKN